MMVNIASRLCFLLDSNDERKVNEAADAIDDITSGRKTEFRA
jgi:hypothetical protein